LEGRTPNRLAGIRDARDPAPVPLEHSRHRKDWLGAEGKGEPVQGTEKGTLEGDGKDIRELTGKKEKVERVCARMVAGGQRSRGKREMFRLEEREEESLVHADTMGRTIEHYVIPTSLIKKKKKKNWSGREAGAGTNLYFHVQN